MKGFEHINATTVAEASELLKKHSAKAIAGGTDLVGVLKDKLLPVAPDTIVNLKTIEGLDYITEDDSYVKIGAMATLANIEKSDIVKKSAPAVAEAAHSVASPLIRNSATIGGNICQDVRCWYYRYPHILGGRINCARKEGTLCSAMMGENRYHSIFGSSRVHITGCSDKCPAHTDIPGYLEKLREGDIEAAARIILKVNPMPALTSRVCAHFCQEGCNRNQYDEHLNIGAIERYVGDYILKNYKLFMQAPQQENGKSVAIVGSGPSGLTAAYYMRQSGYKVTIYERQKEAGGCLMYAIPGYRLPKDIVRKFTGILAEMGIEFKCGVNVGTDISVDEIVAKNDTVYLDTGTWKRPLIGIRGEEMTKFGLEFLTDVTAYLEEMPGADIVVVGGGNVAMDVAITAKRLGSKNVKMFCLEPRDRMPANDEEIERALEEGVEILNGWGPKQAILEDGKVVGMEFKSCPQVFDENGRFAPVYDEDTTMQAPAKIVLMAIGQRADLDFLNGAFAVETERGRIKVLDDNSTNIPGLFAGGDAVTGPATVIKAIAGGKASAISMNEYLGQSPLMVQLTNVKGTGSCLRHFNNTCRDNHVAVQQPMLAPEERAMDKEDIGGLAWEDVEKESSRCFNCGCLAVNPSDVSTMLIAYGANIVTNFRTLTAEELICANAKITDSLLPGEIVTEIQVPKYGANTTAKYDKYRLRQSIDFAVVAVGSCYTVENDVVTDMHITLGAVAPVPVVAKAAEQYLIGKPLTAENAEKAADLALQNALHLKYNEYKIDMAKVMVRRALGF